MGKSNLKLAENAISRVVHASIKQNLKNHHISIQSASQYASEQ